MNSTILEIPGIGAARAEVLKNLGIENRGDLLYYFPRRYVDRTLSENKYLQSGELTTVIVEVVGSYLAHGKKSRLIVHCTTPNRESLDLVFFRNTGYFKKIFKENDAYIVSGKVDQFRGFQMIHPDFESLDQEESRQIHLGRIVPLYPGSEDLRKAGLDSRGFRRYILSVVQSENLEIGEILPDKIIQKYKFISRRDAFFNIHFPENENMRDESIRRLKYEELFLFQQLMHQKRIQRESIPRELWPLPFGKSESYKKLISDLPFSLTKEQEFAIQKIIAGCQGDCAGAYLLQGDVGSGKTVTALAIALHYTDNDIQIAVMAPTEVLANQHYRTFHDLIGLRSDLHIEIVAGQEGKKKREEALDRIVRGESSIIVGTHSLIEDAVRFKSLGLVIVDEQHRFGVEQREKLRRKGKNADMIVMTATPIPRTLSLTAFGDLNLVTLKEKPAGRGKIKTMWLKGSRRQAMYKSIENHVSKGRQCYIVYPVIDESEKLDLRAASDALLELRTSVFPGLKIELLHGRMKSTEKERIMSEFRSGKIQILIATTVIEVGVDVPNATIMIIEHADRFGISQLHQMRGRVGRGSEESFCVLMTDDKVTEEAARRLAAVETSEDGFYLSEEDMKIRGPGEILGIKQHGLPSFRLADFIYDQKKIEAAMQDADKYPEPGEESMKLIRKQFSEGVVVFPG